MKIRDHLWLLKQVFSVALALIWLQIFTFIMFTGNPVLLEEPNKLIVTVEFSLTLFALTYAIIETLIFIRERR